MAMRCLVKVGRACAATVEGRGREWGLCDDYQVLYPLGKGSSARVFKGVHVMTGKPVVIKLFKQISPEAVKKEIEINWRILEGLKGGRHPEARFIELLDTLYDPTSTTFTLVYQFYHGVPLNELISTITYPQALRTALTIAHTLRYIHSLRFIHRDIKPANILMTPSGARLFDFGLTKMQPETEMLKTNNFGTKCYKSPEVIYRMPSYGPAVDVWCLGLVLAEMLLNKRHLLPYESDNAMLSQLATLCALDSSDRKLLPEKVAGEVGMRGKSWSQLAAGKGLSVQAVQLVRSMLAVDPAKRPSLEEVINHRLFQSVQ